MVDSKFRTMGKRGILGEGLLMIYRLLIVSLIAFVVLGVSSVFYNHYIDVRDAEAVVMTRSVVDCISPLGVLDLGRFSEEDRLSILSYCGFSDDEVERFYVDVEVFILEERVAGFSQGDSGAMWVRDIFEKGKTVVGLKKYEPGYFVFGYPIWVLRDREKVEGVVKVEVLVRE